MSACNEKQKMTLVKENNYTIGYITNIGNNPSHLTNDDMVDFKVHPKNKNLKILVVADGVGSSKYGAIAAEYLKESLLKWFTLLDPIYINTVPTLKSLFWGKMREINHHLIELYHGHGSTTLVCAIVGEKETIIANSGDSRGYVISDNSLKQLTADHLVWYKYNDENSILKDDLRFMYGNNYISHCIGSNIEDYRPDIVTIDNDDYEALLLFTDGITDIVSDDKIKFIYDHNLPLMVLLKIIDEAINSEPELISEDAKKRFKTRSYMITGQTNPGKDNATMLLYKKH